MAFGAAGGLAAGLAQGMELGNQAAEVRMKRQALLQSQAQEKITQTMGYIKEGLGYIQTMVEKSGQRTPELEQTVNAYKSQLLDAATAIGGLPGGASASQFSIQTINSFIPQLKTAAEAHTAKVTGEFYGTKDALTQTGLAGAPAPQQPGAQVASGPVQPASAPPPQPQTPMPAWAESAVPQQPGVGVPGVPGAPAAGPTDRQIMDNVLGIKENDETTAQKNLMSKTLGAAHVLDQAITMYDDILKEYGRETAVPGSKAQMLAHQARNNIMLKYKELEGLGALQLPDLQIMEPMIFNPGMSSVFTDFEGRYKASNSALRTMIQNQVMGMEAGIAGKPLKQQTPSTAVPEGQQMAAPEGGGIGSSAVAGEGQYETDEEGWVQIAPGIRLRAKGQ